MAEAAAALASLGVAANIFQFLDLAGRIAAQGWKIYRNPDRQVEDVFDVDILTNLTTELRDSLHLFGPNIPDCEAGMVRVAKDCTRVADRLLEHLGRLEELGRSGKKRYTIKAALMSVWRQDEMKALEQTLEHFKSQLALQLLLSIRSFVSQSSTQEKKDMTMRLHEGQHPTIETRRMLLALHMTAIYPGAATPGPLVLQHVCSTPHQIKPKGMLAGLRPYLLESIAANEENIGSTYRLREVPRGESSRGSRGSVQDRLRDRVLGALYCEVFHERLVQVSDAHVETFRWIFMPPLGHNQPWANFSEWLQDMSAPLYWVTGKLGSGKSTLMKFILTHGQNQHGVGSILKGKLPTTDMEPPWTVVNYYAWYAGQKLQKSLAGLCRSLCYQLSKRHPELLPALFPSCWEALWLVDDLGSQQKAILERLRNGGEREALFHLTREVTRTHKVFFLIDGLDEISGELEETARLVLELTDMPNVKVCASSRPWPVFEDAFGSRPQLAVHRLTMNDIVAFTRDQLCQGKGFLRLVSRDQEYATRLVDQVAEKSAGVFLCVALVVKSLREGLMEDDRNSDLERRLNEYPNDIDMLFARILGDLKHFHLDHVKQYFGLLALHRHCFPDRKLTVLTLSFADEEFPSFAIKRPIEPLGNDEVENRLDTMRRRVESVSKGLLEVVHRGDPRDHIVDYLHRTVFDYLNSGAARKILSIPTEPHRDTSLNMQLASAYLCCLKGLERDTYHLRDTLDTGFHKLLQGILSFTSLADRCLPECEGDDAGDLEKQIVDLLDHTDFTGKTLAVLAAEFPAFGSNDDWVFMSILSSLGSGHWAIDQGHMLIPDMTASCYRDTKESLDGRTFLSIVVDYGICSYVRARAPSGCLVQRLNVTGNNNEPYKGKAMTTIWPLPADALGRKRGVDPRMVRQLLNLNANPGFLFTLPSSNDKTTPLQIAADRTQRLEKQGRRSFREFQEMRKLLVEMSNNPGCNRLPKELQSQLKEILKTPAKDGRAAR